MNKTIAAWVFATLACLSLPGMAAEPSLHEVYQAANSGHVDDAQRMMKEVLQAHPNSGKAHFVEAELLVRQGHLKQAAAALATAERLAPGLPFASPSAVASLRQAISAPPIGSVVQAPEQALAHPAHVQAEASSTGFPWSMLLTGLGLIALLVWISQRLFQRSPSNANSAPANAFGTYRPSYPAGTGSAIPQGYGGQAMGPGTASAPGMGSQILGGLATGAAVGAGVVAGEALMHRFIDGDKTTTSNDHAFTHYEPIQNASPLPFNDLGGNDFGISDSGFWDDGETGDSEWN